MEWRLEIQNPLQELLLYAFSTKTLFKIELDLH